MPPPPKARPIKPAKEAQPPKLTPSSKKKQASGRISAACEACKKRKTKCTGGPPPCHLCENLGTECVIDLSLDMRRRAALQRTIDESKSYQDTLNRLMDAIREGPSPRLDNLHEIIRNSVNNQETTNTIQRYLRESDDQGSDHTLASQSDAVGSFMDESIEVGPEAMNINGELTTPSPSLAINHEKIMNGVLKVEPPQSMVPTLDRVKTRPGTPNIGSLLMALKTCSISEGEEMLRRLIASSPVETNASSPWSTTSVKNMLEQIPSKTISTGLAERSSWHPALQLRSPTMMAWPEGKTEIVHVEQNHKRRFSEAAPQSKRPDPNVMRSQQPSMMRRPSFPQPAQLNTDIPMVPVAHPSPHTPYLEVVSSPLIHDPAPNRWDLSVAQDKQSTRLRIPRHLVLPLIIHDDSYMSRTYTHYLQGARQMLDGGVPMMDVLGSDDEISVDLFFRSRTKTDKFDCASWACEVTRSYETEVYTRLGSAYMLTLLMRWLLVSTAENYQKVPDMVRPTPSQCMIPHIGAIETIPLGPVRDAAIHRLRDWLTPLIKCNWSVNWHHGMEAAVQQSLVTGAKVLTPRFIEHVTDYDNWSVGSVFLETFPEVVGKIKIHD
ncbi:hypothetical protein PV08_06735 [Exophiala spinifera]|uniref:Zn(2)-C6 fungal-type domain-containing protein n=1 Tax=Exophiala spinifera TaxID=91928 RepID=A0A0D2BRV9_9EURO|nr:uncharacterized protein PV08_06735 [Exophiala spinifera]KIW13954.1 hypothetical protein PV08_06735 [Exophiala spinifera]